MCKPIIVVFGILLTVVSGLGQSATPSTQTKKQTDMELLAIVNKYLNIIFVEDKNGAGLSDILTKDFVFDDPFTVARSAEEFISKTQNWIKTKKAFTMEKQFVDKNSVCSLYSVTVKTQNGDTASFQLNDYVEIQNGKISKERVYFSDPVKFAKAMGFLDIYLKSYQ